MELFAIVMSVPAAFVASLVYCLVLAKVVRRFNHSSRIMLWVSVAILGWCVVEVLLLATVGAVRARTILGPPFYVAHVVMFFLGTPALANILLLRRAAPLRWYFAVPLCTAFAFALVLLQYSVSEALYGVDGAGGPFSRTTLTIDLQSYKM